MVSGYTFLLLGLATFRLTRLIVYDQITSFLRAPFHEVEEEVNEDGSVDEYIRIKGKGIQHFIGELLSCHWCTGMWSAICLYIGFMLVPYIFIPVIVILSIAAVSSVIQVLVHYFSD